MMKNRGRHERQIGVGMTARTLRSSRRTKSAVKGELVQNGVPMNTKLGHDGGRQRTIHKHYLNIRDKRDVQDGTKSCILLHAKHCCRLSSQVQVFSARVEEDVDLREVLLGVDIEKK